MTGVIKSIQEHKHFGFIKAADGTEYFFHSSEYAGDWDSLVAFFISSEKDKIEVKFDVTPSPKGPRAANVRIV